jgi:polysaccharide biosynthesis protein PslJ
MNSFADALRRAPTIGVIAGAVAVLGVAAVSSSHVSTAAPLALATILFAAWHQKLLQWKSLVGLIVVVVLFVPISRYQLPASLPFHLELYRLVVAIVVLAWLSSLLIDPRVRLRRAPLDGPLLAVVVWVFASEIANPSRVNLLSSYVAKGLTFFLSFVLIYFVITSVMTSRRHVIFLLEILVLGSSAVAAFAVVERRTGYNVFYHLRSVLPFLRFDGARQIERFGRLRVYASAQHPIALGAALAAAIPPSIYFSRTRGRRWWVATGLLALGSLATGSRTAIVMLTVALLVFLRLKPREVRRLWPALLPALVIVHVFLPGAIGSFREAFFPKGGIVAEQSTLAPGENPQLAGGRIRQLVPMLSEAASHPVFGEGFATRITGFNSTFRNAPILDDQWLDSVLELGYVGLALWVWLVVRTVRRLSSAARAATGDGDDWLFVSLAAAVASFAVGMLTYDAFSFIQFTFLFWILLGLSSAMLRTREDRQPKLLRATS